MASGCRTIGSPFSLLVGEIHRDSAPVANDIIEQEAGNLVSLAAVPKPAILQQVALEDVSHHPIVRYPPCYGHGFEKQEDTLGNVPIRVVLPTNLVDDVVAEGHSAECPLASRSEKAVFFKTSGHILSRRKMLQIGVAVDQQRPVEITPCGELFARQGTEDDDAGVFGIQAIQAASEQALSLTSRARGCGDRRPFAV